MIKYYFYGQRLNTVNSQTDSEVELHPIYADSAALKYVMNAGERFYTQEFTGTLKFLREDYSWIINANSYITKFIIKLRYNTNNAVVMTDVVTMEFYITDCTVNADDGIVSVNPKIVTQNDIIKDGWDREFDLIKLNPNIEQVTWYKRTLVQFTTEDDKIVSNAINAVHWDVDKLTEADGDLENDYHFAKCNTVVRVNITDSLNSGIPQYALGWYSGVVNPDGDFTAEQDVHDLLSPYRYRLLFEKREDWFISLVKYGIGSPEVIAVTGVEYDFTRNYTNQNWWNPTTSPYTICGHFDMTCHYLYARYLCDVNQLEGNRTYYTGNDDIIPFNRNYQYVFPFAAPVVVMSHKFSNTPTQYGVFELNGTHYYLPPDDGPYIPVLQSTWSNGISFWIDLSAMPSDVTARKTMSLRHAYPLASVISVLLHEIAPDVTFAESTDYSRILFDYDSETHPLVQDVKHLFITPKTNIINGDYQTPAQTAPITLGSVLDMLRNVYQLYWFVDSTNKLRIEHVSWFMNGGTYGNPSPTIAYDLTSLHVTRNGKPWSFDTAIYNFDKAKLPSTINFSWMDEVTDVFKGYEMLFNSPLVDKSNNESRNINDYTTDIDFVAVSPDTISKDGFMLLGADYEKSAYILSFYPYRPDISWPITNLQNGWLAMGYLEKTAYWLANLPAGTIIYADGTTGTTTLQSRHKEQAVNVPLSSPVFNPLNMIATSLGNGEIAEAEINLSSLTAKIKLRYATQ